MARQFEPVAAEKSTCFLAVVLDGTDGGLDGWMGWAGGCHRKCGTACRAVDTANHPFSYSWKQARSREFNGSRRYHWLGCPSFRVAQAAINEGPVAVLPAEVRLEEALFVLFLPELVRLLLLLEKFPTARARTQLLS